MIEKDLRPGLALIPVPLHLTKASFRVQSLRNMRDLSSSDWRAFKASYSDGENLLLASFNQLESEFVNREVDEEGEGECKWVDPRLLLLTSSISKPRLSVREMAHPTRPLVCDELW